MNFLIRLIGAIVRDIIYASETLRAVPHKIRKRWRDRQERKRSWTKTVGLIPDEWSIASEKEVDLSEIKDPL